MVTIGYIRVSTIEQDTKNQRHEILDYANKNRLLVDEFMKFEMSSRKSKAERGIDKLLENYNPEIH